MEIVFLLDRFNNNTEFPFLDQSDINRFIGLYNVHFRIELAIGAIAYYPECKRSRQIVSYLDNIYKEKERRMIKILFAIWLIANGSVRNNLNYYMPQNERPKEYIKSLSDDIIPKNAIELKLSNYIPSKEEAEEKEIYFKHLTHFAIDNRGVIYIVDSELCVIYEIDNTGKLISKYEKRGQGPGEFISPLSVFVKNKKIFVWDSRPLRMTRLNNNWEYEDSFSIFDTITPNDVSIDGKIICASGRGDKVVHILDLEGNRILSFGEKPYPNKLNSKLNEAILGISPDGYLYVGFTAIGKIRKYSINGKLEKEIDIIERSSKLIKEILEMNYEYDKNNVTIVSPIIQSIAFIKDDILISLGGLVRPILRMNKNGEIINYYYVKPKYGRDIKCVHAKIDESGNETFYFIQNEKSEQIVAVYQNEK